MKHLSVKEEDQIIKPTPDAFNTFDSGVKGITDVKIGDDKELGFMPRVKFQKWNNECNIGYGLEEYGGDYDVINSKIIYNKGNITASFYPKIKAFDNGLLSDILVDLAGQEDTGAFEFDVTLDKKPINPFIDFTVITKNVSLYKQSILTYAEILRGCSRKTNIVESIAVYHSIKSGYVIGQTNYGCGKVGHIFRPFIYDVDGNWAWSSIEILYQGNDVSKIRVWIPKVFYDKAKYPVTIDPVYGYITMGSSIYPLSNDYGCYPALATSAPSPMLGSGVPVAIDIVISKLATGTLRYTECTIYGGLLLSSKFTNAETKDYNYGYGQMVPTWIHHTIDEYPPTPFKAKDTINLACRVDSPLAKGENISFSYDTVTGFRYYYSGGSAPSSWQNFISFTDNVRISIYLTYRHMEEGEVLNIKTGEKVVLGTYYLPGSLTDVEIVLLNATSGDGVDIGDDVTSSYITTSVICRESDDLPGFYTFDMNDFDTQPSTGTELYWYMTSPGEGISSPPQKLIVGKLADDIIRNIGLSQENFYSDQLSYNSNGNVTSGRIRIYSVAGSVGTDNDILGTYTVTITWSGNNMASYKVVKQ